MILKSKYRYGILFVNVLVGFRIVFADVLRTELSEENEVYSTDDAVFINGKFNDIKIA